jgi:hypothetical protein
MTWEYPWVLWGLVTIPFLIGLFLHLWHQKKASWDLWGRLPFVRKQSVFLPKKKYFLTTSLFLVGFTLSLLGFASPVIQRSAREPIWENVVLVILLDVSRSMEAPYHPGEENATSRFAETKKSLQEFISSLPKGVKISLVPFSEYAVPITSGFSDDHDEIIAKIRHLPRNFFYKQGTDLTTALQEGFNLIDTFLRMYKEAVPASSALPIISLILISDGDRPLTRDMYNLLARRGSSVPVFTIGIGSEDPTYIPDPLSPLGYLTDQKGQPVTTALKAEVLQFIAEKTGGTYYTLENRGELFATLQDIIQKQGSQNQREYTYPYPLRSFFFLGAFVLLLIFYRLEGG